MASNKTLNAKNLEALGAERLSELLIEISTGNAAAKRRLRLELAGAESPKEVSREIRKRLTTIARSRTFIDWRKRKPLVADLETQRSAILEKVAPEDPVEALDLMWRFIEVANPIFDRTDDGSGTIIDLFHEACETLGPLAEAAGEKPEHLADRVFAAIQNNGYGQYDGLIAVLAPVMGDAGLAHLKARVIALSKTPVTRPQADDREVIGWGSNGPVYADEITERSRRSTVSMALKDIADAQGDVDAFIAQYDPATRRVPAVAAGIAARLLQAGRAEEALATLDAAETEGRRWVPTEWHAARLDALEALGRGDDAQAARWSNFERTLSATDLRAYLKRLPDFDDLEAEERALDHVMRHAGVHAALAFLINWSAPERAAALVLGRTAEIDGDHYEVLTPAAEALSARYPLAATLLLRAMIDFSLSRARSKRYRHAAQHLVDCSRLATQVDDYGEAESHEEYEARLRATHGRKAAFWALV